MSKLNINYLQKDCLLSQLTFNSKEEGPSPFKSMVKHDSQAISRDISYGPTFQCISNDIHIADNAGQNSHSYTRFNEIFSAPSPVKEK